MFAISSDSLSWLSGRSPIVLAVPGYDTEQEEALTGQLLRLLA